MRGQFIVTPPNGDKIIVPNTITEEGAEAYLDRIFRNNSITGFYVGLCNQVPANADTLASITSEPTVTNGYAREQLQQNSTDWPTIDTENEESYILSKQIDFTASGGAFSTAFSRLFLCSVASGTTGVLYAYSAALTVPVTLADGVTWSAQYQMFLNS